MTMPSQSARRILGADHPLARVETGLAGARDQALVCAVLIAGSPVMLVAGRDAWFATAASAALVALGVGVEVLVLRAARRQRIHDLLLACAAPDIDIVCDEVRRLRSERHRLHLAACIERALADGEHWHELMPAARPPHGVRNLPTHAVAVREIARGLRESTASARAVVMVERLATGGYGSALYEADQVWLGRELRRIRYELAAGSLSAPRLRDAA
jgi:hypothetical protein